MKYESVVALKKKVLGEIDTELDIEHKRSGPKVELLRGQRPENRVAVGCSKIGKNNFRLELRVQRRDKWAYKFAQSVVESIGNEANFEIIPRIEIPSIKESSAQARCTPIVDRETGLLQLGLSIGPRDGGVGTLGAFLSRADGVYVLSCNHVMVPALGARVAQDSTPGDPIYHPGREQGYRLDAVRQFAALSNYATLSRTEENDLDCAIAKIDAGWNYDATRIPVGSDYPNEGRVISTRKEPTPDLLRDLVVCKIGRTTCYSRGVVRAVELDRVPVYMPGLGDLLFSNVVEIRSLGKEEPFSLPGDSGSLVFTEDRLEAIGLVFAGGLRDDGYKVSYVCALDSMLEWAKAELLK